MLPKTKSFNFDLDGERTELVVTLYATKIFVIITQIDKMGTIVTAESDTAEFKKRTDYTAIAGGRDTFTVDIVLGDRSNDLLKVLVRHWMQILKEETEKIRNDVEKARISGSAPKIRFSGMVPDRLGIILSISLKKQKDTGVMGSYLRPLTVAFTQAISQF